ncbi:MAG: hypothetical protein GH143_10320 [Calditrichaeota bacterium]|nr:hypothetical protein [Calditrichota bacterium]
MGAGEGVVLVGQYSHQVWEAAFNLYCQNLSAEKITRRIPEMYGDEVRPHLSTIERWIRQGNWTARREEIHREREALADQHCVRTTAELLADMSSLREKILDASNSLEFKSAKGAVRSQATLQRIIDGLTQPKEGTIIKWQLEAVVETIFQALRQDEVLGPVLAERQADIMARIEARLSDNSAAGK